MCTLVILECFLVDGYGICVGRLTPSHLEYVISQMVAKNLAVYEPVKQTRSVLLYWRLPEEWAEVLHEWVRAVYKRPSPKSNSSHPR